MTWKSGFSYPNCFFVFRVWKRFSLIFFLLTLCSVFEAERPGCRFSVQQRLGTYFFKVMNARLYFWLTKLWEVSMSVSFEWTFLFPGYNVCRCWIWMWYYRPRHCKHDHDCKAVWFLVYHFHYIVCTIYTQYVFHVQSLYVVPSFPLMLIFFFLPF